MEQEHGVAGIDPHKHTATIAVVDQRGGMHGCESFAISESGIENLLAFLLDTELVIDRIGVEGSAFLGRPLVLALTGTDPHDGVRGDIEALAAETSIPDSLSVTGLVYATATGRIELVERRAPLRGA